jgi:hypothetical protein
MTSFDGGEMSEQPGQQRVCPTCGNAVPSGALYCPSCGTRLEPASAYDPTSFEDALADILDDSPEPGGSAPTTQVPVTAEPAQEWSATPESWSTTTAPGPTGWSAEPAVSQSRIRGGRTLWIILAIFGFLLFCCCGLVFISVAVASTETALQQNLLVLG